MVRAFIAVDISQEARAALADVINGLQQQGVSGVRWVRPEGIHLTLKFLGEIDPGLVDGIMNALGRAAQGTGAFRLALSDIGAFPSANNPRVIWAGLEGELDTLKDIQEKIDREVHSTTGLPMETRPFTPHLTLGRMGNRASSDERRRAGKAMAEAGPSLPSLNVSWRVEGVSLIRSTLTPQGAVYDLLGSRKL